MSRARIFLLTCLGFITGVFFYEFLPKIAGFYWFWAGVVCFGFWLGSNLFKIHSIFKFPKPPKSPLSGGLDIFLSPPDKGDFRQRTDAVGGLEDLKSVKPIKNFSVFHITKWLIIFLTFFCLGVWRMSLTESETGAEKIYFYNSEKISFSGFVSAEPEAGAENQKFELEVEKIENKKEVSGKVLVFTSVYPIYEYGDVLQIDCKLNSPEPFSGFAYDRFLAKSDIYSVCYYGEIDKIGQKQDFWTKIYKKIINFRQKTARILEKNLGKDEADIAKAMVLGYKNDISDKTREDFSRAGLSHILAISGMHIGILVWILMEVLFFFGLRRGFVFLAVLVSLGGFVFLVGSPASALRAFLMAGVLIWAWHLGRLGSPVNSLLLAGSVLLLFNPRFLRDDLGFQMSFLAVFGIVFFFPFFSRAKEILHKKYTRTENKIFSVLFDIAGLTISAQTLILPLVVYNFGVVSFVSVSANLALLWLLPAILIFIFVGVGLSFLASPSLIFLAPANLALSFVSGTARFFADLPGAYFEIEKLDISIIVFYYFILVLIFSFLKNKTIPK